jgi:hypothetical protein
VRRRGLEPLRLAALDPKSSASANFATSAWFRTGVAVVAPTDKAELQTRRLLNCTVSADTGKVGCCGGAFPDRGACLDMDGRGIRSFYPGSV